MRVNAVVRRAVPRLTGVLVAVCALALLAAPSGFASGNTSVKPYSVVFANTDASRPAALAAPGRPGTITATIKNLSTSQSLGSANLKPPSNLTVATATITAPKTAAVVANVVQLRNLALAPGASATVTLSVSGSALSLLASCKPTTYLWTTSAKQSNDYNGSGNDFSLNLLQSDLRTTVGAGCALRFSVQPADADPGVAITGAAYDPAGVKIAVAVVDSQGRSVPCSDATVALAIGTNPGGGTLGGTTSAGAVAGTATFTGPAIDKAGAGYTLVANSPGIASATSNAFRVQASTAGVVVANADDSTPATVRTGETATLKATVTNLTGGRTLGSTDLVLPAGLRLLSASSSAGTATAAGDTAQLRGLGLAPGASATVTLDVASACAAAPASLTWPTPVVRSSADFTGPVNFTVDGGASQLGTSATGSCSLRITTQPRDADPGAIITGTAYDPAGPPVAVEVLDADGARVTSSTTSIGVAIGANPGAGTLAGTATATAVAGVATFGDLSIDQAGDGYTLTFSAADATSDESAPFLVEASTYAVGIAPATIPAGQRRDLTVTVSNRTGGRTLTGADLTVPAGLTAVSASSPAGTATIAGDVVQLRDLALPRHGSVAVTVRAEAACSAQTLTWATPTATPVAFTFDAAASSLGTEITGNCSLNYVTAPADALAGQSITGSVKNPGGPPVAVEVLGGDGLRATSSSATVTITRGGTGTGALSGTSSRPAAAGVATLGGLSIDTAGSYALVASSPVAPSITSAAFTITGIAVSCAEDITCSGTLPLSLPGSNVTVTATQGPNPDLDTGTLSVATGIGGGLDCALYTEITPVQDVIAVDYDALDREKTVAETLPLASFRSRLSHDDGDDDEIQFLQSCFGAPYTFAVRPGTPLQVNTAYVPGPYPAPEYKGLLPDCGRSARQDNPATPAIDGPTVASAVPPCVQSRKRLPNGDAVVTTIWPSGRQIGSALDPRGRF